MSGGGTIVTRYGRHSAAHAAGTLSIGVVVCTDAHAVATLDDGDNAGLLGAREGVAVAALPPHALSRRQDPPSTVRLTNRTSDP